MSQKTNAVIVSVVPTTVNTKRGPAVKNTITTSAGAELQTFKADMAQTAASLIGQQVEIEYDVTQNGEWTNYYPISILPASNPALQAQMAQAIQSSTLPGAQVASNLVPGVLVSDGQNVGMLPSLPTGDYFADPKTVSIHRQVAAKVAAQLVSPESTPQSFWENCEALVVYFSSGATPLDLAALGGGGDGSMLESDIPFAPTL